MNLKELSDRLEIIDLITRYTRAIDTRSWDDLDDVFSDDGTLDYSSVGGPVAGLAEAKPWVAQGLAGFDRYQHVIGQVAVEMDGDGSGGGLGDRARATAYFTNPMVSVASDGTETLWEVGGYYHHELVRTAAGWRSQRMVDELVWSRGF